MGAIFAVPFVPVLNQGEDVSAVLNDQIAKWDEQGFRFLHLEEILILQKPGCLWGLLGAKNEYSRVQVAIVERMEE